MRNATKIIHLSDLHFGGGEIQFMDFFNKRFLGYLNNRTRRRKKFPPSLRQKLLQQVLEEEWDYLLLSGDLTNFSLEREFLIARKGLEPLIQKGNVIAIPGNHDRYIYKAAKQDLMQKHFGDISPLCWKKIRSEGFFLKPLGKEILLVGLDMSVPRPHHSSRGRIFQESLDRCSKEISLIQHQYPIKIAMGHYPAWIPKEIHDGYLHQLTNKRGLQNFLLEHQFHAYLHGHVHKSWTFNPVENSNLVSVNSGGMCVYEKGEQGGYHQILIQDQKVQIQRVRLGDNIKKDVDNNPKNERNKSA